MTTHLDDSLVDSRIVTFSPVWLGILRQTTQFSGLLMSDGLLMLKNYTDKSELGGIPELAGLDPTVAWAMRAILAGHDFVIVEGSAGQTLRVFKGVLNEACQGTPTGNELAGRIEESYNRIRQFKLAHEALLSRQIDVPTSIIGEVIAIAPPENTELRTFRFNSVSLSAMAQQIARATFQ
jgi:beta-glucosidase-like glycosyl hydrolase